MIIELRTLGGIDLTGSQGQRVSSLLHQPKRFAVFAYLSATDPGAFQDRDQLLSLFWPDADPERASDSLSRSLDSIRRSLGNAALEAEGSKVRVARGAVWCDAAELGEAVTRGELERALDLYRGRFLDGVSISDAPEFERWVDLERTRLQETALDAALALTERDASQPDRGRSLLWARRGVEISPYDERPLRLVMRLLEAIGERTSAHAAYESYVRRLRDDLGAAPSRETVELAARLAAPADDPSARAPTSVAASDRTSERLAAAMRSATATRTDGNEPRGNDPMILLRTLGGVDLTGSQGRRVTSLLHQPKRLAVFTYLAVTTPEGFQGRDKLLALFWPDTDSERASHSLSQSLYYIGRSLGKAALETDTGNVRVARGVVGCDAVEFQEAVTRGALGCALELYRGSFLDGFYIGGAPDFERWVDREKARLQGIALEAALELVNRDVGQTDRAGALRWARRGMEISPYDERPLRLVMRLLGEIGDRSSAWVTYESFARRLSDDLGLDPSPETVDLAAQLSRPAADPPVTAAATVAAKDAVPGLAEARSPTDPARVGVVADAQRSGAAMTAAAPAAVNTVVPFTRRWANAFRRRGSRVAAAAFVLFAALVWRTSDAAVPAHSPRDLVILPFTYHGDARYAYLAEGLPELIGIGLNDLENFEVVKMRASLRWAQSRDNVELTRGDGNAAARHFGADRYVLGSIIEAGGRFQIMATTYRLDGQEIATFQDRIEGEDQVFRVVDDLARTIMASRFEDEPDDLLQRAAVTTRSLPALKRYLAGEKAFRVGQYQRALEAFEDAVTQDSTFAIAWYRMSAVAGWVVSEDRQEVQARATAAAIRHSARLTDAERSLIEAQRAFQQGLFVSATRRLQSVLDQRPENVQAWFQLGEVGYHYNPLRGMSVAEAAEPFEQVLARDPEHVESLKHLAAIRASEGRFLDVDTLVRRMLAVEDHRLFLSYQALRAFALDDERLQTDVLDKLSDGPSRECDQAVSLVARMLRDPAKTEAIIEACLRTARTPQERARSYLQLAHVHLARGRIADAHVVLRIVEQHEPRQAFEYRVWFALEPFLPVPTPATHLTQGAVSPRDLGTVHGGAQTPVSTRHVRANYGDGPRAAGARDAGADHRDALLSLTKALGTPLSHQGVYLAALLAAKRGAHAEALDHAARLERLPGASERFRRALAQAVRADVQRRGSDRDSALSLLRAIDGEMPELSVHRALESPITSFARERFLRAELLRQQGRHAEALGWYRSLGQQSIYELIYVAPSHLGQAQIYEHLGDVAAAAAQYSRFLKLWDNADPSLQPIVDAAYTRLLGLLDE